MVTQEHVATSRRLKRKLERLSVVVAEDHGLVRAGLTALLRQLGLRIVGEAETGRDVLPLVEEHAPDLVVLDMVLPKVGGIDLTRRIRRRYPATRVLIVSLYDNPEYVQGALDAGAAGYILKDADPDQLARAVRRVAQGRTYIQPMLAAELARLPKSGGTPEARRIANLSPRQREVLSLVAAGHSTREVATRLGIGVKTVETHRRQLQKRLGIRDVAGLVRLAIRHGLISVEP